eukprot:Tamp_08078.p1 GENE.Tamp_08078~~Tamp_08078.p1  ORF type:complete len:198 (-),score=38.69 Tamp_08078:1570-2163(-)
MHMSHHHAYATSSQHQDTIQENFLNEVFLLLEHHLYTPGEEIVSFRDPADRLIIFVQGKVKVDFEHATVLRETMVLRDGEFIGDMAILGITDWAHSSCFYFNPPPAPDAENTEILVVPHLQDYVVVYTLNAAQFQKKLLESSMLTQNAVSEFASDWDRVRANLAQSKDSADHYTLKAIAAWQRMTMRQTKKRNNCLA